MHAVDSESVHREAVGGRRKESLDGDKSVGLPWAVISGFLRLITNAWVAAGPSSSEDACRFGVRRQLRPRLQTL